MKKILMIIFMYIIASNSFYGVVNKEEETTDYQNTVQENVVQNEIVEQESEDTANKEENLVEQTDNLVTQENNKDSTEKKETQENKQNYKNSEVQKTQEKNNVQDKSTNTTVNIKQEERNDKSNTQTATSSEQNKNTKKVDLSKYSYYEKASDGSYKAFMEDKTELNKLKTLIDSVVNSFGYKNIKVTADSSLTKDGTMYFTANKTNVENLVYDSEGFNIYYYAIKEYWISPNGTESYFQTRSYIKVK